MARPRRPDSVDLAGSTAGDVGALGGVGLATSDINGVPGPVGARAVTAGDDNVVAAGLDGAGDTVHGEVGDGDAGGRVAVEVTAIVVLLDEDTVLGDGVEGDVLVGDALDGAGLAGLGLDTETVDRVLDGAAGEGHGVDSVVGTTADGSDGETVAARADAVLEGDVCAGVDGNAVVLVVNLGTVDDNGGRAANVETIGVVTAGYKGFWLASDVVYRY